MTKQFWGNEKHTYQIRVSGTLPFILGLAVNSRMKTSSIPDLTRTKSLLRSKKSLGLATKGVRLLRPKRSLGSTDTLQGMQEKGTKVGKRSTTGMSGHARRRGSLLDSSSMLSKPTSLLDFLQSPKNPLLLSTSLLLTKPSTATPSKKKKLVIRMPKAVESGEGLWSLDTVEMKQTAGSEGEQKSMEVSRTLDSLGMSLTDDHSLVKASKPRLRSVLKPSTPFSRALQSRSRC